MVRLLATSVVRGARQGESHGGVYLVDFERRSVVQKLDWNTADIDWAGRGWDRGLRGIAFHGQTVLLAASDELFLYSPDFELIGSYRCPYLRHAHEISVWRDKVYIISTGFDAVLGFDLAARRFDWGLHVGVGDDRLVFRGFDPQTEEGPSAGNALHLNSVTATDHGLFISGLRTPGLLRFDGRELALVASLPAGTHNAQPFGGGVLFNDTQADMVRYVMPSKQRLFRVPIYDMADLTHTDFDDTRIARQGFGRGLCAVSDTVIAAGSSPSTIALHDLTADATVCVVTLSRDIRNAIHGLEVWPFN